MKYRFMFLALLLSGAIAHSYSSGFSQLTGYADGYIKPIAEITSQEKLDRELQELSWRMHQGYVECMSRNQQGPYVLTKRYCEEEAIALTFQVDSR